MSNLPELNDRSANPTGQFGYTPLYAQERPEYDFQRGGPPTARKPIVVSEWEDHEQEYILLVSYDPQTRLRSVQVLRWIQTRLRWDPVETPSWAKHSLDYHAEALFYPKTLPLEAS